jgi:hypothetical protein
MESECGPTLGAGCWDLRGQKKRLQVESGVKFYQLTAK